MLASAPGLADPIRAAGPHSLGDERVGGPFPPSSGSRSPQQGVGPPNWELSPATRPPSHIERSAQFLQPRGPGSGPTKNPPLPTGESRSGQKARLGRAAGDASVRGTRIRPPGRAGTPEAVFDRLMLGRSCGRPRRAAASRLTPARSGRTARERDGRGRARAGRPSARRDRAGHCATAPGS